MSTKAARESSRELCETHTAVGGATLARCPNVAVWLVGPGSINALVCDACLASLRKQTPRITVERWQRNMP